MIQSLNPSAKKRVIKLYLDAFVRQKTPCPSCQNHCCIGCQSAHGYHTKDVWEQLKTKYGWVEASPDNWRTRQTISQGFFVKGQGCRLPYKERSAICVGFTCTKMNDAQRDAGQKIWFALKS